MRLSILIFYLLSISGCSNSQGQTCSCSAVLIPKHVKISVYEEPDTNSKIVSFVMNDTINEDYVSANIMKIKNGFAYVSASAAIIDTISKSGWIKVELLGIYPNDYSKPIKLYSKPDKNSSIKSTINNPQFDAMPILNCRDKWLYIKYKFEEVLFEGWLPPDNQCSNPYTTCS